MAALAPAPSPPPPLSFRMATPMTSGLMKANLFIAINRIIFSSFSSAVFGIGTSFLWASAPPAGSGGSSFIVVDCAIRLTQRNNHGNISELLDNLLRGYDNSIRPDFGGPPAVIEVDIMVRSMGPISEVDMTYSMDCYFRQSWVDRRLEFSGTQDTLALSISMLGRIWKPDTYFYNGKQSYLHTITTPNKFVRLHQDGRVLYSSRLTIKAGCPMNLEDFPMDIQRCPLKFGSFGYSSHDVLYRWNSDRSAVAIAEDMKLSQFDLVDCPAGNVTDRVVHSTASMGAAVLSNVDDVDGLDPNAKLYVSEYSMLLVSFHLQRHMGNFLIQVYGPCVLLVVLSWVSFWLNREATADRVSLGITTVLTMTFLGLEARTDLPKVPYPTALDFFVFLSFAFIFATILQFAVVHYFTKYGSGECYFNTEEQTSSSDDESDLDCDNIHLHSIKISTGSSKHCSTVTSISGSGRADSNLIEVIPLSMCSIPITPIRKSSKTSWADLSCFGGKDQDSPNFASSSLSTPTATIKRNSMQLSGGVCGGANGAQPIHHRRRKRRKRTPRFNSVSKIDRASRIFFPLLFLAINLFYWYLYLSRSARLLKQQKL
ncbi:gamma-aminobutyric acid receptor alpha-like [Topomyia yanbarensis]|uniref:gamma-aminobutyric acid receptor alpha-like n=1 Tax=Topomyia yanbarensis TaxID=2498891 RepID=UPI00273B92DA|nr:gamma-aminobutyric acid receptor alpha-like [Topomyia yanbarensis]XP_058832241.1 gamma-aminobutyric acid receptor alpha-like [Topomyia yanbarensis]XP_058832242.1 gamma-aminobutyric acid receptor alpha-like [Topomyia yanbarensis]XP_058832243.1 gamma-aminobutyric acid receptor alpha-like [Topomyia yanbarensis]XP_058832244.1 gamma-aminobutyric acid receptor alpha-like [Topomyia yanbarensis]XP_058832245.1 gamma-aminobutyric acid receptor alpha-like [Topomyia yanbarensis]